VFTETLLNEEKSHQESMLTSNVDSVLSFLGAPQSQMEDRQSTQDL